MALLQSAVLAAVAAVLWARLPPLSPLFAVAAVAQAGLGVHHLRGGAGRARRWVGALSLLAAAALCAVLLQTAGFVFTRFADVGAQTGWVLMGGGLAGLPWFVGIPLWQLLAGPATARGASGVTTAGVALLLAGGGLHGHLQARATTPFAAVDGLAAAAWLLAPEGPPPDGPGPVALIATVVRGGNPVWTAQAEGDSLAEALTALPAPPFGAGNTGLILESALTESPPGRPWLQRGRGTPAASGRHGFRTPAGLEGAWASWRSDTVTGALLGTVRTPALALPNDATALVEFQAWLATADAVVPLERGWTEPTPFTAEALVAAALAGGRHLATNMTADGRFAYVVEGPSGEHGPGYNFPRHAGGAWFLARLWQRTGDPGIRVALEQSLDFLAEHTRQTEDGRRYVLDPSRRDGRAWVGTNALALLAFIAADHAPELQQGLARHLASSVDDRGRVRGDLDVATATWPEQPLVTYAEGQVLLGLAAAERAGLPGVREALERAAAFIEHDYWPAGAGLYLPLDEHWMCLGSVAAAEVLPFAPGETICRAWLQDRGPPPPSSDLAPPAGPAAATAEAWIAAAELDRRAGRQTLARSSALDYTRVLLDQAYQALDAPLVARPDRLIGGFRDRPHVLDVRVDSVQHIACALLGAEQLLRNAVLPGALP